MAIRPTVIIVPGAWQCSSVWDDFRAALDAAGYPNDYVVLPSVGGQTLPLAGLAEDIAAVRTHIGTLVGRQKDIVLVCHCSGAVVGSNACQGFDTPSRSGYGLAGGVTRIVFLAGILVPSGSSLLDVLGGEPLPWMHVQGDRVTGLPEMLNSVAFNDLSSGDQERWASQMTHTSLDHFQAKASYSPWDHGISCAYIFCLNDKILPHGIQQHMVGLLGSKATTAAITSSHYPFLSAQGELLAAFKKVVEVDG